MNARLLLPAGLGLILLSNAVALAGVWYNRQGEPSSRLLLSQRELLRDWDGPRRENSGLSMRLDWRMPVRPHQAGKERCHSEYGLTPTQLQAVGLPSQGSEPRQDTRQALAILELDGPLYQQSLHQAERHLHKASAKLQESPNDKERQQQEKAAREALTNERDKQSRLFLADVGLDAQALRQSYPDRSRYLLLRGSVRVWRRCYNDADTTLSGSFTPSNGSINVPHSWHPLLAEQFPQHYGNANQPFTAEVSVGQRLEPWLSNLWLADKPSNRDDEHATPR